MHSKRNVLALVDMASYRRAFSEHGSAFFGVHFVCFMTGMIKHILMAFSVWASAWCTPYFEETQVCSLGTFA